MMFSGCIRSNTLQGDTWVQVVTPDAWDGGHDWRFWDQSLKLTLENFYSQR